MTDIDYCGYGVLPMAIQRCIVVTVGPSDDKKLQLVNYEEEKYPSFETTSLEIDGEHPHWWNYFLCGVKGALDEGSNLPGMKCIVDGSIPPASGLSSSSAVVVAATLATFCVQGQLERHQPTDLADMCAKAERFIGTQGGGMDQAIELLAVEGKALSIEFNPIRTKEVSLPPDACFVIANSCTVANKAAGSEFNQRVVECRLATKVLAKTLDLPDWKNMAKLVEVQRACQKTLPEMLEAVHRILHPDTYTKVELVELLESSEEEIESEMLTPNTRHLTDFKLHQRALHVFSEAHRVEEYQRISMSSQSLQDLGSLMYQSHESCTNLYECSHPNLDKLVNLSKEAGALGARLTGAGWGGCIVALVPLEKLDHFMQHLLKNYYSGLESVQGQDSQTYLFPTKPGPGAQVFYVQA